MHAMADADMRRRIKVAAAAFAARRGDLGLTQEETARRGNVSVRTVINFESQGTRPNAVSRARLERAVQWPSGEIDRLANGPAVDVDPHLLDRLSQLSPEQRDWLIGWLRQAVTEPGGPAAAAE
jgi:transcriptional regulator with XRE-family HTH domain